MTALSLSECIPHCVPTALRTQGRRPRSLVAVLVAVALGLLTLPLVPSPAQAAAATFKQLDADEIQSGKFNSLTFNEANTAGNLIVVYLAWTNTDSVQIVDSNQNQYQSVDLPTRWGPRLSRSSQVFYAANIAGGANTVRATFATASSPPGWASRRR